MSDLKARGRGSTDGRPRRATIAEVAALAGVSPTTVSHVFSGKRLVSGPTRERVHEAVKTLGYRPNNVARSLRTSRSKVVAVIVPDVTNPFYGMLTRGLADAVQQADYATFVCNTDGALARERTFIEDVVDRGVDAVVMGAVNVPADVVTAMADAGVPFVCVGTDIEHPRVDRIVADDESGSLSAVEHLLRGGPAPVAMVSGPGGSGAARVDGYRRALEAAGLPFQPEMVVHGDWTRQGGRRAMRELLGRSTRPRAVFCANDLMAIGAMDEIREAGLRIPEDVRLVGFDDIEAATLVSPALTTVRNPSYEAGSTAGSLLLARMSGEDAPEQRTVVLPCRLVQRASA